MAAVLRRAELLPWHVGVCAAALVLIALLVPLHRLWAAQLLLVPLLLVLPGVILLRALRVPGQAIAAFPVYVPCASLIVLLGAGLVVDLIGPLVGVAAPIRAGPLLAGVEIACLSLLAVSLSAPRNVAIPWRSVSRSARLAWPLILPVAAAAGALRLNSGHGDGAAVIAVLACVAVLSTALVMSTRLDDSLLAVVLYAAGLAMMWSFSLRGVLVSGFDIASEYHDLHQTVLAGVWHPAHPRDTYGAMLSVTVLPAELHFLSGVPDWLVFGLVYPAIAALLPVAVFGLARRILPGRWALAAGIFVLVQAFGELPDVARQEIAMVLFAALLAAMLDTRIPRRSHWALVALLGLALAVSHYTTSYLAIALIGFVLPLQWVVSRFRAIPRVTGAFVVAFGAVFAGTILWYGPVTHINSGLGPLAGTIQAQGFDVLPGLSHGQSLFGAYLQGNTPSPMSAGRYGELVHRFYASHVRFVTPLPDAGLPRYALHNSPSATGPAKWPAASSALSVVWLIVQQLENLLGAVGALLMVLWRKAPAITRQVGLLGLVSVVLLAMIKLSGTLANFYNWDRALLQGFVVLAITLCWCLGRVASRPKWHRASILATAAALGVIFICASGLANVALGGGTLGGGTPLNLANGGEDFDRYYVTAPELATARWLSGAVRPRQLVYADRYAQLRLFALTGRSLSLIGDVTPLTLNEHAWVYADRTNVIDRSARALFGNSTVNYVFPAGFLHANYDLVYTNGSSEVYHR